MNSLIKWGIIGCGDVTEVKSGPAFNKINHSSLVAVMRRDGEKAKDYANRHQVPKWYDDAARLINDPDINAIYIATPPSSHEEYAIAALQAGKPVYVEKPMTVNLAAAKRMQDAVLVHNGRLVVAHYRRAQPLFRKIRELLGDRLIGEPRFINLRFCRKALTKEELNIPKTAWRVDTAVAGGGLFHDMAPHQLDILYHFFGDAIRVNGISMNQANNYAADDMVAGQILYKSGLVFQGVWSFNVSAGDEADSCEIIGSAGSIQFSFFENKPVVLNVQGTITSFNFNPLPHVQQPMIQQVVDYFLDKGHNPCSVEEGVQVMELLDRLTAK